MIDRTFLENPITIDTYVSFSDFVELEHSLGAEVLYIQIAPDKTGIVLLKNASKNLEVRVFPSLEIEAL